MLRSRSVGRLLSLAVMGLGLTGCGTGKVGSLPVSPVAPTSTQTPPMTLTGNWLLVGSRVPPVSPTVSTSLYIQGSTVFGEITFSAQCASTGVTSTVSSVGIPINGTIANDGTFQASIGTLGDSTLGTTSLSLTGNSPLPATPSAWTGTYSLVFTPGSRGVACGIAQTSTFAATPIAPLTGTYIGVPFNTNSPFGSGAVVSVQITQNAPTLVTLGKTTRYLIPLTATLTVSNSPCFFSGSTTGLPETSSISGDSFTLFLTSGLPYGFLSGTLNDPTANTFFGDLTSLAQVKGCPGIAFYNFTRQ